MGLKAMADSLLDNAFSVIARRVISEGALHRHWELTGGVSAQVHALEISCPPIDHKRVVVRRHGSASWKSLPDDVTAKEYQLLSTLHKAGLPVPEPLLLDTSRELLPSPFFVMAMVDGTTTISKQNLQSALRQMANFLAHLHRLDPGSLDLSLLQQREDPIQGVLDYLPGDSQWDSIREVVSMYTMRSADESLLHGDYWPGNILWDGSELVAVIDWEDAAIGSSISDLAMCRAELDVQFGDQAVQSFTKSYLAAHPVDVSDLRLWEVYVGSAALATLHDWGLPPAIESVRRERTSLFVARAAHDLVHSQQA